MPVPPELIPGDCFLYFDFDPRLIPSEDYGTSMRRFLKKTDRITGGLKGENTYILLNGRYPDTFAEKRISESQEWAKDKSGKYYINREKKVSLFFAENNNIFVTNYSGSSSGSEPMDEIIANRFSGNQGNVFSYTDPEDKKKRLQLYSTEPGELFEYISPDRLFNADPEDLRLDIVNIAGKEGKLLLNCVFNFKTGKEAVLFSAVIKLYIIDALKKDNSSFTKDIMKKKLIRVEGSSLVIQDIEITEVMLKNIIRKMLKGKVLL